MNGYMEALLVVLAINVISAYAASLPLSAGQLNLGTAGFMAVGAYVSAWLTNEMGISIPVAIVAGAVMSTLIAIIVGIPVLRTHGIYLALATVALGQVLGAIFLNLEVVGAAAGYPVNEWISAQTVMICGLGLFVFVLILSRTRFWLYLTAIKNDETVTDLFGINVKGMQLAAFALGAALAGFAGGIYGHYFSYIEAQHFTTTLSIYTVLYVILGGIQTVWGPLVGAIIFTFLPEIFRFSDEWRFVVFAVFIIAFMVLRPEGIITSAMTRRLGRFVSNRKEAIL